MRTSCVKHTDSFIKLKNGEKLLGLSMVIKLNEYEWQALNKIYDVN